MGHFVYTYPDHLATVRQMIGSGTAADRERVVAATENLLDLDPEVRSSTLQSLDRLLAGNYPISDEEHPDAPDLNAAFHLICRAVASVPSSVEIDMDEERFPEMWSYIWSAESTPFHLPLSEYGTPAVGYWPPEEIDRQLQTFRGLDFEALQERSFTDYREEIEDTCKSLEFARANGMGVFVFCFE